MVLVRQSMDIFSLFFSLIKPGSIYLCTYRYYAKARDVLHHYSHMPSFHGIHQDCDEIVKQLIVQLREQLRNPKVITGTYLLLINKDSIIPFGHIAFKNVFSIICIMSSIQPAILMIKAGIVLLVVLIMTCLYHSFLFSPHPNSWPNVLIYFFS